MSHWAKNKAGRAHSNIKRVTNSDIIMEDNTSDKSAPLEVTPEEQPHYTITSVCKAITSHHNKTFDKIHIVWPIQMVDGSEVSFADGATDKLIATARIRVGNRVFIHSEKNDVSVGAYFTDLRYNRLVYTVVATDKPAE